jgi:hypothetical protein
MKHFIPIVVRTIMLCLLLSVVSACAQGGSEPKGIGGQSTGGTGSEQVTDKITPTAPVTPTAPAIGGARLKIEMYAWLPSASGGGSDLQEIEGEAFLVFDRQDGPPKIFTVHGSGFVTWKEDAAFEVCSLKAEASGILKVEGVLDPNKCQAQLVITEIYDDPVTTSKIGPCDDPVFTSNSWVHRVDLPLVNNVSATTGPSLYDLKVTIFDILLDDSIICVVP